MINKYYNLNFYENIVEINIYQKIILIKINYFMIISSDIKIKYLIIKKNKN